MITDFGHTAFFVKDIDSALAFYAKLGINESFRLNHPDGSLFLIYLHISGDRFLELFPNGPEPVEPFVRVQSFHHICLITDDIEGMVDQLRSTGCPIDREVSVGLDHNKQAWTHDPDGNPIELMQLNPISPQAQLARGEIPRI